MSLVSNNLSCLSPEVTKLLDEQISLMEQVSNSGPGEEMESKIAEIGRKSMTLRDFLRNDLLIQEAMNYLGRKINR